MGPLFDYCNKPSLGPWTHSPGTVPPTSCRYINSGAIIGVCAFSELSGIRGGLFELLFLSLLFSALSPSYLYRFYSFSLCFCLFLPLPRFFLSYLSTFLLSLSSVFILFFLLLIGLHLFGSPFNSVILPFCISFFSSRLRILTPPLTCLFSLVSSSVY